MESPQRPRQSRPLGDITSEITNTPCKSTAQRSRGPVTTISGSVATSGIQRFSLRSRSATGRRSSIGREAAAVTGIDSNNSVFEPTTMPTCSARLLRVPPRFGGFDMYPRPGVRICDCSADPGLRVGHRRLCKRDTHEHEEMQLLEAMNRKFIKDCRTGGESIASRACLQEMEVFFILEPSSDTVVGYVALKPHTEHGITPGSGGLNCSSDVLEAATTIPRQIPLVAQLYVEPGWRRQGFATGALRVLLAGRDAVVADTPSLHAARAMLALGFKSAGATRNRTERHAWVLYVRLVRHQGVDGGGGENML